MAECSVASGLYFTHHQHPMAPCNYIEFATRTSPVASDDRVALTLVPRGNEILSETSPRLIRPRTTRPRLVGRRAAPVGSRRVRR